jgi:hypothetical protein
LYGNKHVAIYKIGKKEKKKRLKRDELLLMNKKMAHTIEKKKIIRQAILLERSGRRRSAATMWLKCFDIEDKEHIRDKIASRREICIEKTYRDKTEYPERAWLDPSKYFFDEPDENHLDYGYENYNCDYLALFIPESI